ncbi:bifunctional aspartokinase I/homoserine dehydrogenase I [Klebsiella pneumoniae]|uniref:Bifunctional aspartokinase I/homoserine dehydrogenase I n=1 Tax=Klebsiella pneumoniae TaxID=573 RepID=A0A447RZ73_KLEPN|nr:bifunctional aspartokinase I/homoserine dehydrogenase I [Klebsiella pneumoniae]
MRNGFCGLPIFWRVNARQGQVATVLSAPAKITNHLVAMIEKTIGGQDALPNIADAERIFAELLQGLADAQPASRLPS